MKKTLCVLAAALLLGSLSGCGTPQPDTDVAENPTAPGSTDLFSNRDYRTDHSGAIAINLKGNTAETTANGVQISGSDITITAQGTYILTGTLEDGTVTVDAGDRDKLQLVLQDAHIQSTDKAPLKVLGGDKVFLTLAGENSLSNAGSFTDEADGALFSRQDLTVNGSGSLSITSPGGHGIVCKDDLVFTGGSCQISCSGHGLEVNDSVRIADATLDLNAGQDGIHCENADDATLGFVHIEGGSFTLEAQGDGISAGAYANILGGSFTVTAGGGSVNAQKETSDHFGGFPGGGFPGGGRPGHRSTQAESQTDSTSMKGIKAAGDVFISGGTFLLDTADDGFHADNAMTVSGGTFDLKTGDDAFHAEQTLTVSDGMLSIQECYEGLEALTVNVSGGEILIRADDDGINAAGGTDESGFTGGRDGMFGGRPGGGPGFGGSFNGSIHVSGGKIAIYACGDGLDANGSIAISGGELYVTNPGTGDTSVLDCETEATITGGKFLGIGASVMMAQSFTSSTQGVLACSIGSQPANTPITVTDAQGNTLISCTSEYPGVLLIVSTPEIVKGESYTVTVGADTGTLTAE